MMCFWFFCLLIFSSLTRRIGFDPSSLTKSGAGGGGRGYLQYSIRISPSKYEEKFRIYSAYTTLSLEYSSLISKVKKIN